MRFISLIISVIVVVYSCGQRVVETEELTHSSNKKITGVNFVAPINPIPDSSFIPIKNSNAEWVALIPFAYAPKNNSESLFFNTKQWYGETTQGVIENATQAKKHNLRIMVKPQIWIQDGEYTGDFDLPNDSLWNVFESNYTSYIVEFAKVAELVDADLFCIGTELENFFEKRPKYWLSLIDSVKTIYHGKLTYGGNWDSYKNFPFWEKLDFIGVDAYFPLSENKEPSIKELQKSWEKYMLEMEAISTKYDKQILFTEYGYRSMDYSAREPWVSSDNSSLNLTAQKNCYEAMYNVLWTNDWFAGGFLWKWFDFHKKAGGMKDNNFTPQNKPVEMLIKEKYKKFN